MKISDDFLNELTTLINVYGVDRDCDTHDFVLAQHLVLTLEAWAATTELRHRAIRGVVFDSLVPETETGTGAR